MVEQSMNIPEKQHPDKQAKKDYELLVGINEQKTQLLKTLQLLLDEGRIDKWAKTHHKTTLSILAHIKNGSPLIILSGEVGCGKTALAQSVGTPLAELLGAKVKVFETPSNIRGNGLVGAISSRITEVFESVVSKLKNDEVGLLVIDEADDLATSRSQNQAHHEDRAGLNVLIRQIDAVRKSGKRLAVIMITNRIVVLDPAVRRRTSLHLVFDRPSEEKLEELLQSILHGTDFTKKELDALLKYCNAQSVPFSYSDLIQRVAKQALFEAVDQDRPFDAALLMQTLEKTEPTPLLGEQTIN
jgi:AAA+ superfamily predicted ATPase